MRARARVPSVVSLQMCPSFRQTTISHVYSPAPRAASPATPGQFRPQPVAAPWSYCSPRLFHRLENTMAFLVNLGAQVAGAVGINLGTQLMRCSSCDHHAQVEVNKYVNEDPITLEMGADCPRCKAKNTVGVSDDQTGEAFETKMKDVCTPFMHRTLLRSPAVDILFRLSAPVLQCPRMPRSVPRFASSRITMAASWWCDRGVTGTSSSGWTEHGQLIQSKALPECEHKETWRRA